MRRIKSNNVEVDMVPMIDVVSLLLMFLIVVGDATVAAGSIEMRLPRADQALKVESEGRLVIQLRERDGKYWAVIFNKEYELVPGGRSQSLHDKLKEYVDWSLKKGLAHEDSQTHAMDMPVKLRIPEKAPMREVERILMALSEARLVNVHYAALPLGAQ